jgi:hypothetical protein
MNSIDLRVAELVQRRADCVHEVLRRKATSFGA